jgi:hypothetical protein
MNQLYIKLGLQYLMDLYNHDVKVKEITCESVPKYLMMK